MGGPRPKLIQPAVTLLACAVGLGSPYPALAFDWVPTDEELTRYHRSWNPRTHGAIYTEGADLVLPGQWSIRAYVQGQIGNGNFENQSTSRTSATPFSPDVVEPDVIVTYGLTKHLDAEVSVSGIYWRSDNTDPDNRKAGAGIGTTSLILKYRPIVQDPDSWRPSIGLYSKVSLPTNEWFGTPDIPGGFTPLSRVPSSRFGSTAVSEGLLVRKNLQPVRLSGGIFYTYNAPGGEHGRTTYGGDLISTRLALEHVLHDRTGFGYLLELATLHQLSTRLDGHAVNSSPPSFWLFGVQPAVEYTFFHRASGAHLVGAAGVMVTVAGHNDIRAIYPNISFKYFFDEP
jgi:hypothetical protein